MARIGIHVFGRHVDAVDAERIMWGDPGTGQLGQITLALLLFIRHPEVAILSFGTGASKKNDFFEAQYWYDFTIRHLHELPEFWEFRGVDLKKLEYRLDEAFYAEVSSLNTAQECRAIIKHYQANGIEEMIAVSAPSHLPRCMLEMTKALLDRGNLSVALRHHMQFRASDIPYAGTTVADVAVIEPPHRGDDFSPPLYRAIPRFFRVKPEFKQGFYDELCCLLSRFGA